MSIKGTKKGLKSHLVPGIFCIFKKKKTFFDKCKSNDMGSEWFHNGDSLSIYVDFYVPPKT